MEHDGVKLPWWEFRPTDFALPGSVAPPDARKEEGLVVDFLRAAARAETADCFISGVYCCRCSAHCAQPGTCVDYEEFLYGV